MKHFFTFSLLMAIGLFASAQITVTNDDVAPAGTTIINSIDNSPDSKVVPGSPGPNKTWDFATLNQDESDTLTFMLPSWTPYPTSFPDANFAAYLYSEDAYAFFNRSDDKLSAIGLVGSYDVYENVSVPIIPEEIYMDFPVQFGQSNTESFYIEALLESDTPPADSAKYRQWTEKTSFVDSWGTLSLPMGTYNALRIKEERTIYDSIWGKIFGTWVLIETDMSTSTEYKWITNDVSLGYYLVTMDYDADNQLVNDVEYMNVMPVGINEKINNEVVAYPNPVKNIIHFNVKNIEEGNISIYNLSGQVVPNKVMSSGDNSVSVSDLPKGIYFYVIKDKFTHKIYSDKFIKN